MGYGAVKYADLKNSRLTNYKFSMDEMLNMKGNTAVYLLYAHARIAGIIRKSGKDVGALKKSDKIELLQPQEVRFLRSLDDSSSIGRCLLPAGACACVSFGPRSVVSVRAAYTP